MSTVLEQIEILEDEWRNLYSQSWTGVIAPEAFAHPAKFSRGLIRFIYSHVIAEDWIRSGDSVVDPFGGVALGGLDAMRHGLQWTGCELEEKFVGLGNQNIALWNDRYSRMPNWGTARLLQGDSRKLASVLSEARCCVSSPPYSSGEKGHPSLGSVNKDDWGNDGRDITRRRGLTGEYADNSEGQLGAMKEGDLNLAIASPPYVNSVNSGESGIDWDKAKRPERWTGNRNRNGCQAAASHEMNYGAADGQLGSMKEGAFDAAISSPPFPQPYTSGGGINVKGYQNNNLRPGSQDKPFDLVGQRTYQSKGGDRAEGNLEIMEMNTFWSASRIILEQLYSVLTPDAHAVFVVKAFVRNKQIVDFPAQWAQLCEAVGFRLIHHHKALLTEEYGTQTTFHGEDKTLTIARKSFFRRLAESKGSPRIDHESVLCFEKRGQE